MTRRYRFLTSWRVPGTVREVVAIMNDVDSLPSWWPSVYLSAQRLDDGGMDGVGRQVELRTTGWLPYTLRWVSTLTEPVADEGFAIAARGDLTGTGRWTFEQDGPEVVMRFDWQISAAKPLLRHLGWMLSGVFTANHRWAMARGEESLKLELRRRRAAATVAGRIPPPPRPTFRALVRH